MKNKKIFRWIFHLLLILLLGITLLIIASLSQYTFAKSQAPQLGEDYLQQYFNGSVLVAKAGKILLRKGYGYADFENRIPNTPSTVYRLGSVTKQFTAMAILILEERGKLSTKDTISKYIPDYPLGAKITIHHLLTHTSGIPEFFIPENFPTREDVHHYYTPKDLIALFKDKPLNFTPGEHYLYSSSNYILLGYLIEKTSGMKYEDFVRQNILVPLHMDNSGFEDQGIPLKNEAIGYSSIVKPDPIKEGSIDMSIAYAAGALCSTVDDLYKWDQALYTEKLVKKATLQKMFTPYSDGSYGYGWNIGATDGSTVSYMFHGGWVNGFSTYISRNIKQHVVIILLSNDFSQNPTNYLDVIQF